MKKILFLGFAIVIALGSCKPKPSTTTTTTTGSTNSEVVPTPCFTLVKRKTEVNNAISPLECSKNAFSWEWDFGDGSAVSTIQKPTHTYTTLGTFKIKLTVKSEMGKYTRTTTDSIIIGERYIDSIVVKALNFTNSTTGKSWDFGLTTADSAGPDLFFRAGPTATGWSYDGRTLNDIQNDVLTTDIPVRWVTYALATPVKITNENWDFGLYDRDASQSTEQSIFFITNFNPVVKGGSDPKVPIKLSTGGNTVYVYWSIK